GAPRPRASPSTVRRSAGDSLQAQPAPCEKRVRRTGSGVVTDRSYGRPSGARPRLQSRSGQQRYGRSIALPTPDEWRSEVDQALFGADDDAPRRSEQPGSFDFPLAPEGESE